MNTDWSHESTGVVGIRVHPWLSALPRTARRSPHRVMRTVVSITSETCAPVDGRRAMRLSNAHGPPGSFPLDPTLRYPRSGRLHRNTYLPAMNLPRPSSSRPALLAGLSLIFALTSAAPLWAQAPSAAQLAKYDRNKNGVLDPDEQRALDADLAAAVAPGPRTDARKDVLELSPFTVNAEKDNGFSATNAGTATKLGLDMKDMAAPYSVMTGEFLAALNITDIQEAALWSTNGAPVIDGQGADQFAVPAMYNIRGQVINAGQQRNFFTTAATGDTYNTERIDFGRGPNAVLFNTGANSVLGGGISSQTKRARLDRDFDNIGMTAGSWDYYRATLDVNRRLTDKLAVRGNLVWQDRDGYMDHEFEKRQGVTLAGTYRLNNKTELRFEALHDKIARTRPTFPSFDRLSGWDGTTVFDAPITNAQLTALGVNGERQGIERLGNDFVFIPGDGTIMNWTNMARTRRGDSTPNVPLYSGGRVWTRNGNAELLAFGNWATQQRPATPSVTQNGDQVPFKYNFDLPDDRFDRAMANSKFRIPGKQFTNMPEDAAYTSWDRSFSVGATHQFSDTLYFEASGTYDRYHERIFNNINGFRDAFLDINKNLPNGQPNPHYLDVYGQGQERVRERWIDNAGARASLNYLHDFGKWGNYTFNLTGAVTRLERDNRQLVASVATATDAREWQGQAINIREYWGDSARTFAATNLPTSFFNRVASTDGNSFTTSTTNIRPSWVLNDWGDETETTKQGIFAMAGRYFGGKLVFSGGARYDAWKREVRSRPTSFGFMPANATWNGWTLDDRYWRPNAPADWKTLTYTPRDANGNPTSTVPILAIDRPTIAGANGVNVANPLYANDRFRNDYNAPIRKSTGVNTTASVVYHLTPWMSLGGSYGDSYAPRTGGGFFLDGSDAEPEVGKSYDGVVRFTLFQRRALGGIDVSARSYFNRRENVLGDPPGKSQFNALLGRNDARDATANGRNQLGFQDIIGGDFAAQKNKGIEIEIAGRITRGWRMTGSIGTGRIDDYDRFRASQAYFLGRKEELRSVLEAAGGRLDTTQKPTNAPSAPGLAVVNTSIAAAVPAEQQNAVNDYNNFWVQFDTIPLLADTIGIKRMTVKFFTDYTVQEGRFRGVRFGLGANYVDHVVAGYRSGDTVANPNYNAALPVTAANRPWMDDPTVDLNTPVWIDQPFEMTGTLGYTWRIKSGPRILQGKEVQFNLIIRNLLNWQRIINQDEGVALRPPNGDFSAPNRVAQPSRIGAFQKPINFELTTTLKL
jgi:hypothetical protein